MNQITLTNSGQGSHFRNECGGHIVTIKQPSPGFIYMERWKDIEGFGGYEISDHGRVKSIGRDWHEKRGKSNKDKILRLRERRHDYYAVALYKNKKQFNMSIHRLVAQAFVENPNGYNEVNHKDGDKQNNHYANLEWCTHSYNAKHAIDNGHHITLKGSQMHNSKLTESDVLVARQMYVYGVAGFKNLSKFFGVSKTTMMNAVKGITWKHI